MLISSFVMAAAAATKWLTVAKIMTTVGTCALTAAPAIETIKNKKKEN